MSHIITELTTERTGCFYERDPRWCSHAATKARPSLCTSAAPRAAVGPKQTPWCVAATVRASSSRAWTTRLLLVTTSCLVPPWSRTLKSARSSRTARNLCEPSVFPLGHQAANSSNTTSLSQKLSLLLQNVFQLEKRLPFVTRMQVAIISDAASTGVSLQARRHSQYLSTVLWTPVLTRR